MRGRRGGCGGGPQELPQLKQFPKPRRRNRYLACQRAGVGPRFTEWDGVGTPTAFVISKNLTRRHLNTSQRAMIAAKLAKMPPHRPSLNK